MNEVTPIQPPGAADEIESVFEMMDRLYRDLIHRQFGKP